MQDAAGLAALQKLGVRTVPVVSRGEKYVFAQVIKDVIDFLGLEDDTAPELSPTELTGTLPQCSRYGDPTRRTNAG